MENNVQEHYQSGELKFTVPSKNGLYHGLFKQFYETGKLQYEGAFENDKQEGIFKLYYDNGDVQRENTFKNNEKVFQKEYYKGGQLLFEGQYYGDIKSGTWKYYYENGKIKKEERFMEYRGILVCERNWDENGRLINEKKLEIDDIKEVLRLLKEFKPKVKYFTQYEYHKGYSQTNETSLSLNKVDYDYEEGVTEDYYGIGTYEPGKPIYDNTVYECEVNILKLDSFIDLLNQYIDLNGDDCDDWSCDTFFEWFQEIDKQQIFDKDNWVSKCGYAELEDHDITWCVGFNNFNYHGIKIDDIETDNMRFSFSGFWGNYDGQ